MVNIKFPETNVINYIFSMTGYKPGVSSTSYDPTTSMLIDPRVRATLKHYAFRVPSYLLGKVKVGDVVVCKCTNGYQVCEVVSVNDTVPASYEISSLSPVVAVVNMEQFFEDLEQQNLLKQMEKQLIEERKKLEKRIGWDLLAEKDPKFKAMLDSFRAAGGQF